MKIEVSGNIVNIYGNIKSIQDYEEIKSIVDGIVKSHGNVVLNLIDSIAITSSVIGYLTKLASEGVKITMNVGEDLYKLFSDLDLLSIFNVRQIKWIYL